MSRSTAVRTLVALLAAGALALLLFPPWSVKVGSARLAQGRAFLLGDPPALGLARVDLPQLGIEVLALLGLGAMLLFWAGRRRS